MFILRSQIRALDQVQFTTLDLKLNDLFKFICLLYRHTLSLDYISYIRIMRIVLSLFSVAFCVLLSLRAIRVSCFEKVSQSV